MWCVCVPKLCNTLQTPTPTSKGPKQSRAGKRAEEQNVPSRKYQHVEAVGQALPVWVFMICTRTELCCKRWMSLYLLEVLPRAHREAEASSTPGCLGAPARSQHGRSAHRHTLALSTKTISLLSPLGENLNYGLKVNSPVCFWLQN